MIDDLTGKVVWITGAARGIGKGIAQEFARRKASLALTDVMDEALAATAEELTREFGVKVISAKLDVTDSAGADAFVQRCVAELGGLTALINNAGITRDGLLIRMSEEDWDRVININLKGSFVCAKAAVKVMMKARYGKVVNIASVVGVSGNAGQANYVASKAGIIGLTKTIAKELGGRGIRTNAVAPGFIVSEMTEKLTPEIKDAYQKNIPLGYFGSPDDVARVCAFLVSTDADYINGQVLVVDGGMHT
jgi:3-oxoacyl-[acyl-carrier protein] reductase